MLNIPIVHKQISEINELELSFFEEIEYKQIVNKSFWKSNQWIEIVIQKNTTDEEFEIIIKNIPFKSKNIVISLNNKINYVSPNTINAIGTTIVINSKNLSNTLFKDVKTIAVAINVNTLNWMMNFYMPDYIYEKHKKWERFSELNIKIKKNDFTNKSFFINQNGLNIENYNSMTFKQSMSYVNVKYEKSKIKIIPKKIALGKHNTIMFDVKNLSSTPPPIILAKTIEGLNIAGSTKKNKAIYAKSKNIIDGIIGNIYFDENSYYDLKDDKTYTGIGINSRKGYIVPYKYSGDLIPILNLNIGSLENIQIGFSNPIKSPYFDKYSGLIKMKINKSDELYDDNYKYQNKILNSNFLDIISGNLSVEEIINLGKYVK